MEWGCQPCFYIVSNLNQPSRKKTTPRHMLFELPKRTDTISKGIYETYT